jgi:hypothetical protein
LPRAKRFIIARADDSSRRICRRCSVNRERRVSESRLPCAENEAPTKMHHERFGLVGGGCSVFAIADPDLLVCGASVWDVLAEAAGCGVCGGAARFVAACDCGVDSLSALAVSRHSAACGGCRCGAAIDFLGNLDSLARASRSWDGAAGGKDGDVRCGGVGGARHLCADSASAICGIVFGGDWGVFVGWNAGGLDCGGGLGRIDVCGDFNGREGIGAAVWRRLPGLLPESSSVYSGDSLVGEVVGRPGAEALYC